jgi:hypothetical protein
MAEIEKPIPTIDRPLTPEQETELVLSETEVMPTSPTEVTENEDGSVDINFDPKKDLTGQTEFNANLAEVIEEQVLGRLGSELYQDCQSYKDSRSDWEKAYTQGLDLL